MSQSATASETEREEPTFDERAKFFIENSAKHVGYHDTLSGGLGSTGVSVGSPEEFVRNLAISTSEGAERVMRNKREHGHHPIKAWNYAMEDDYPEWFKVELAESQLQAFDGDPEFMSDEETEYVEFLMEEFDVPR